MQMKKEDEYEFESAGGKVYLFLKRGLDIVASTLGLIVLSPIIILVAIAIKLESKGPVLFSQDRVGKNGKIFKMYKMRSMVQNAEELK